MRVSNLENGSNIRKKLGRKVTKQVELPSLVQSDNADINHDEEAMRELDRVAPESKVSYRRKSASKEPGSHAEE